MAKSYRFDDLLRAIAGAVQGTNRSTQEQFADYLDQHFSAGEDGVRYPDQLHMLLPAQHVEPGADTEQVHSIPTAALSPPQTLAVDELELSFKCSVTGLDTADDGSPTLKVALGRSGFGRLPADVRVKFKNGDPPEGMARINDRLLKTF